MDKVEFERAFSVLYFALAAHTSHMGLIVHGGQAFAEEGRGVIHLADGVNIDLSLEQIVAYRQAGAHEQQAILHALANEAEAAIRQAQQEVEDAD